MSEEARPTRPNIRAAIAWTSILSVFLSPLILIGPFFAGYAGGRKAKTAPAALIAALGPALIWVAIWLWLSNREFTIGHNKITPPVELAVLAPTTGLAILGGAFAGSGGKLAHIVGAAVLVFALAWFGRGANELLSLYNHLFGKSGADAASAVSQNKTCPDRLKKLYDATMLYADSWDQQLPPAENWMSALRDPSQTFGEEEFLHCPDVPKGRAPQYGYAMNRSLGGKRIREIADPAKTPLFFDSDDLALNANAPGPTSKRHEGKSNVVYADGHLDRQ